MAFKHECPGPDRIVPNVPEDIICPHCGAEVEMWTHDKEVTCPKCGKTIKREDIA